MKILRKGIEGLFVVEADPYSDNRGLFLRSFCRNALAEVGVSFEVVQGNVSYNHKEHTLRGFHYQKAPFSESKILTCLSGSIFNVVADLRPNSKTFLKHEVIEMSASSMESLLVPEGCANAFLTMEDQTLVHYYMSDFFKPERYAGFRYNDPTFDVKWPFTPQVISERDANLDFWVNSCV